MVMASGKLLTSLGDQFARPSPGTGTAGDALLAANCSFVKTHFMPAEKGEGGMGRYSQGLGPAHPSGRHRP